MSSTSLAPISDPVNTLAVAAFSTAQMVSRVRRMQEVMDSLMKRDTHYGTIPGTDKPCLYQPGAELLCSTFRVAPSPKVEDLSTGDNVRYRVTMQGTSQSTGELLGEGVGECSSDEEKYRWRRPVCDEEFAATPEDLRREKWVRSQKGNYQVKQVRVHPADIANTVLKMAYKRALISMTRTVLACSDIFAQDLEDLPTEVLESVIGHEAPATPTIQPPQRKAAPAVVEIHTEAAPEPASAPVPNVPNPAKGGSTISEPQSKRAYAIGIKRFESQGAMFEWLKANTPYASFRDIKVADYDDIIAALDAMPVVRS